MNTHIIETIDGQEGWWYEAYYSNDWPEKNAFRMDTYPYKNDTHIEIVRDSGQRAQAIYRTFREEGIRLAQNDGQFVIPEVTIRSPKGDWSFENVRVTSHNIRSDLFQEGAVTALDVI